jgi:hypothetical protein
MAYPIPISPDVSDTDYSKGPHSWYKYNENWILIYLNEAQQDTDDEWGRTERIALRHLTDHVTGILEALYGEDPSTMDTNGINGDVTSILNIVDTTNSRITLPNGALPTTILTTGQLNFDANNKLTANNLTLGTKLLLDASNTTLAYISGNGTSTALGSPSSFSISMEGIGGVSGTQTVKINIPKSGGGPYERWTYTFSKDYLNFPSGASLTGVSTATFGSVSATTLVAYTAVNIGSTITRVDINSNDLLMTDNSLGYTSTLTATYLLYKQGVNERYKIDVQNSTTYSGAWKLQDPTAGSPAWDAIEYSPPTGPTSGYLSVQSYSGFLYQAYLSPAKVKALFVYHGTDMGMTMTPYGMSFLSGMYPGGTLDKIYISDYTYEGSPTGHSRVSISPPLDESSTLGNVEIFQYNSGMATAKVTRIDSLGIKLYDYNPVGPVYTSLFQLVAGLSMAKFIVNNLYLYEVDPAVDSSYTSTYIKMSPGSVSGLTVTTGVFELNSQAPSTSSYKRVRITDEGIAIIDTANLSSIALSVNEPYTSKLDMKSNVAGSSQTIFSVEYYPGDGTTFIIKHLPTTSPAAVGQICTNGTLPVVAGHTYYPLYIRVV